VSSQAVTTRSNGRRRQGEEGGAAALGLLEPGRQLLHGGHDRLLPRLRRPPPFAREAAPRQRGRRRVRRRRDAVPLQHLRRRPLRQERRRGVGRREAQTHLAAGLLQYRRRRPVRQAVAQPRGRRVRPHGPGVRPARAEAAGDVQGRDGAEPAGAPVPLVPRRRAHGGGVPRDGAGAGPRPAPGQGRRDQVCHHGARLRPRVHGHDRGRDGPRHGQHQGHTRPGVPHRRRNVPARGQLIFDRLFIPLNLADQCSFTCAYIAL
jgi:hypothetical protein